MDPQFAAFLRLAEQAQATMAPGQIAALDRMSTRQLARTLDLPEPARLPELNMLLTRPVGGPYTPPPPGPPRPPLIVNLPPPPHIPDKIEQAFDSSDIRSLGGAQAADVVVALDKPPAAAKVAAPLDVFDRIDQVTGGAAREIDVIANQALGGRQETISANVGRRDTPLKTLVADGLDMIAPGHTSAARANQLNTEFRAALCNQPKLRALSKQQECDMKFAALCG